MEELTELITRAQAGDREAREILIERNLGLVHTIVRRFLGRGVEPEDLFQIGAIGLMKAVDKFDLGFDVKFSTYAVPMITGEIKRYLRDDGMVKVSRSLKENAVKVRLARQRLQNRLGREPFLQEIAGESGLTAEEILSALEADRGVESLYSRVTQADGSEVYLVDKLADGGGDAGGIPGFGGSGEDAEKERLLNRMLLDQLLGELGEKERELIRLRYFQDKTQTEVARRLGVSQVQVSRLEKRILLRMREMVTG